MTDSTCTRLVVQECQAGDPRAAANRPAARAGISLLEQMAETAELAEALLRGVPLPEKAAADALHLTTAAPLLTASTGTDWVHSQKGEPLAT